MEEQRGQKPKRPWTLPRTFAGRNPERERGREEYKMGGEGGEWGVKVEGRGNNDPGKDGGSREEKNALEMGRI